MLSKNPYEFKMISSDDNRPALRLVDDGYAELLIGLHEGIAETEIARNSRWTLSEFNTKAEILCQNGFLKRVGPVLKPSLMIISHTDAAKLREQVEEPVSETADLIGKRLEGIKNSCAKISSLEGFSFSEMSLLILSNVLLDNWQIENVERLFLKTDRPLRHGKRYYAALMEKTQHSSIEAHGIYGNQVISYEDYDLCIYGNRRYAPETVGQLATVQNEYIDWRRRTKKTLFPYPILSTRDNTDLSRIAESFTGDLLQLLERHKPRLLLHYRESMFASEVSFEEYFLWLYHLYYTDVTDRLIRDNIIFLPPNQVTFYITSYVE